MEEIICWRDKDGVPRCNLEQASIQSSPNGMNWTSEGTGPTLFAKNVLALYVDHTKTDKYFEEFMHDLVLPLPEAGGKIIRQEIIEWLRSKGETVE